MEKKGVGQLVSWQGEREKKLEKEVIYLFRVASVP